MDSKTVSTCRYCGECFCYVYSEAKDSIYYCSKECEEKAKEG